MNRAITASALALAFAAPGVVLAPAASAAAQSCVTSTITTGAKDGVGSTANKSSTSSCNDLNLVYADDKTADSKDWYAGRLYSDTSSWKTCSAGYIGVVDGSYAVNTYVLCTSVNDGTKFTVASSYDSGDTVKITH
uniref:Uncharacterized protein n=1 Tax=Streptomyces sp. NBC_01393 TaxID=2903851 RepID=A0AAU3ICQ5_9ACTN